MLAIEAHNPSLKGVLPKEYARSALNKVDARRAGRPGHREFTYIAATTDMNILADGGAYPAVRPDVVAATEIVVPGDVLENFSAMTGRLIERIKANKAENHTLAALRHLLLPKLMSGEIRVKDAEKFVGETA